jgi:hypothetical protein
MPSNSCTWMPRLLPALLWLAAGLPCQNEQATEDIKSAEDARRAKAAHGERAAKGEAGETGEKGEDESDRHLTPEQRLARHITSGASAYCRFRAALKPEKLLPGQTGTLTIVASLLGDAVLPAPPPTLELVNAGTQGEVTLGTLIARPAPVGRHARGYLGRPVYDNYALLDVPVTLSPNAAVGTKHVVAVELKFDLYDGNSAQPIGRFLDRVSTTIEAGRPLDPVVQGVPRARSETLPPTGAQAEPPPPVAEPKPAAAPVRSAEPIDAQPVAPAPLAPAPAATEPGPATAPPTPDVDAGGGLPLPLLFGGGVLLLAVVVLLTRRR